MNLLALIDFSSVSCHEAFSPQIDIMHAGVALS